MEGYDLRIDNRLPSSEEIERLIPILRDEKKIDVSRPIRHWTIDYVRAQNEER